MIKIAFIGLCDYSFSDIDMHFHESTLKPLRDYLMNKSKITINKPLKRLPSLSEFRKTIKVKGISLSQMVIQERDKQRQKQNSHE